MLNEIKIVWRFMGDIVNYNDVRFKVEIVPVLDGFSVYEAVLIVLIDKKSGKVMQVSDFSNITLKGKIRNRRKNTRINLAKTTVQFLNYLYFDRNLIVRDIDKLKVAKREIDNNIVDIRHITINDGNKFLNDYKRGIVGKNTEKKRSSIEQIQKRLTRFYRFLYENYSMKYIKNSDFEINTVRYSCAGQSKEMKVTTCDFGIVLPEKKRNTNNIKERLQYLSFYAVSELISLAVKYKPMIALGIAEQAFAGLRAGEVCNTTHFNISSEYTKDELTIWSIDLREKPELRSDGIDVGEIKSRDIAYVHPSFLPFFDLVRREHERYIKNVFKKRNIYGAVFMTRDGLAMTDQDYHKHFAELVIRLVTRLRESGNSRAIDEANFIEQMELTPHTLRFYFSQTIAKFPNVTVFEVAMFRRDKKLNSAMTYIRRNPYLVDDKIKAVQRELMKKVKG